MRRYPSKVPSVSIYLFSPLGKEEEGEEGLSKLHYAAKEAAACPRVNVDLSVVLDCSPMFFCLDNWTNDCGYCEACTPLVIDTNDIPCHIRAPCRRRHPTYLPSPQPPRATDRTAPWPARATTATAIVSQEM